MECIESQLPKQQLLCFPKQSLCTVHKQTVRDVVHLDNTVAKLNLVGKKNYTPGFNLGGILIREGILLWALLTFLWTCATMLRTAKSEKVLINRSDTWSEVKERWKALFHGPYSNMDQQHSLLYYRLGVLRFILEK